MMEYALWTFAILAYWLWEFFADLREEKEENILRNKSEHSIFLEELEQWYKSNKNSEGAIIRIPDKWLNKYLAYIHYVGSDDCREEEGGY